MAATFGTCGPLAKTKAPVGVEGQALPLEKETATFAVACPLAGKGRCGVEGQAPGVEGAAMPGIATVRIGW